MDSAFLYVEKPNYWYRRNRFVKGGEKTMGLTIHWDLELKGTDGDAFGKLQELKTLAERLPLGKIEGPAELDFTAFQKAYKAGKRYGGWKH